MNITLICLLLTLSTEAAATTEAAPMTETPTETPPSTEATPSMAAPAIDSAATPQSTSPAVTATEEIEEIVDVQETDPTLGWYFGEGYTEHNRILALPTARTLRKNGWEFLIDHRASSAFHGKTWTDTAQSFGGLDGSLSVGLALRYSVLGMGDIGIYRVGGFPWDTYEFDARFQALKQEVVGIDVAIRAGVTWFAQPKKEDASGFFAQLIADRVFWNRLLLGTGVMFHSNSSTTNGIKYKQDKEYSLAIPAFAEIRLYGSLGLAVEVVSTVAGFYSKYPAYSAGLKYFTNRHTFAFVFGNTADLTADGYVTNSQIGFRDSVIGFNLTREY
jgi:hypothetical protein